MYRPSPRVSTAADARDSAQQPEDLTVQWTPEQRKRLNLLHERMLKTRQAIAAKRKQAFENLMARQSQRPRASGELMGGQVLEALAVGGVAAAGFFWARTWRFPQRGYPTAPTTSGPVAYSGFTAPRSWASIATR